MDLHTWIAQQVDATEALAQRAAVDPITYADDDRHSPAAVLRRCEADRRILARHQPASDGPSPACDGCNYDGSYCPELYTENINDCPELLDLAHALGITDKALAGLDRPQPPERKTATGRLENADILTTPPITTSDVPAALRGPRWKP